MRHAIQIATLLTVTSAALATGCSSAADPLAEGPVDSTNSALHVINPCQMNPALCHLVACGEPGAAPCAGGTVCDKGLDVNGTCVACGQLQPSSIDLTFHGFACQDCSNGTITFSTPQPIPVSYVVANIANAYDTKSGTTTNTTVDIVGLGPSQTYKLTLTAEDGKGNSCAPVVWGTMRVPADEQYPTPTCNQQVQFTTHGGGSRPGPVTLVPIMWGNDETSSGANLDAVYWQFQTSNYYGWLRNEYGAPRVTHTFPQPTYHLVTPSPTTLREGDLESQLDGLIRSNSVPTPYNPMYIIHLASGIRFMDSSGNPICSGYYAYNKSYTTFDVNGGFATRYYAVIPDPSMCGLGWGGMTRSLSHELAELLTDPDANGWRDNTQPKGCQEIGDICNLETSVISTGFALPGTNNYDLTVQKLWSNAMGACVTEDIEGAALF